MSTMTPSAVNPPIPQLWRPYANESMLYKPVETPDGPAMFTIDPWTRRWAILQAPAVALLRHADGRHTIADVIETLSSDAAVPQPKDGWDALVLQLHAVGLLWSSQSEHRAGGLPVYNKTDITSLHLEITNACNMHCIHCYVASGRKMSGELSLAEILKTIDMLPPFSGRLLAISGGEPTIHKDIDTILEYAAITCGHDVDLYTNGKRFPRSLAQKILDINQRGLGRVRIQVSIEGASDETHDMIRGKGTLRLTLKTLGALKEMGLSDVIVLFACVTKFNIHEIDAMIRLAEDYDVAVLAFSQWQRQGNASETPWASIAPTTEQWVEAGEKLLRYHNPRLVVVGNFYGDLNNNDLGRYSLDVPLFPKHLYFYNACPRVSPDGNVWADQLWVDPDWVVGNVRTEHLDDCFDTPKFYDQLAQFRARIDKIPECQACEWKDLCQSGSPGHTYAEYGHMNAKDLFCESRIYWFNRYVEHQVQKLYGDVAQPLPVLT